MTIVILLDQRGSRSRKDLVTKWSERLNERFATRLILPFTRTSGDEMQAVPDAGCLGAIARETLTGGEWWIGIGIGTTETPLPADTREGRGPAFWNARKAIEEAKAGRRSRPVAVAGGDEIGLRLTQCLDSLAFIINRRTEAQQVAAESFFRTGSIQGVAADLKMSVQGARKNVLAAGCEEEKALESLVDWIADPATTP